MTKHPGRKLTQEEFLERLKEVHRDLYDFSLFEYKGFSKRGEVICNRCGRHFFLRAENLLHGQGCKVCNNIEARKKYTKTTEQFIEKARQVHGNRYDYSKASYINTGTKVEIICPVHGSFWQTPGNHTGPNRQGCPKCKASKGESQIRDLLDRYGLDYEVEKTFDDLIYKKKLRFDFYLPDYNLCIEYQGKQHYREQEGFVEGQEFEDAIYRDKLKRGYCSSHNIDLLEIKYNENIKEKIIDYLNLPRLDSNKLPEKERIYLPQDVKDKLREWYVYDNSIRISSYDKFKNEFPEIYKEYKTRYKKVGIARELAKDLGVIYYEKNDSAPCIICGNDSLWNSDYNCMRTTCSAECGRKLSYINLKKTLNEEGIENSSQKESTSRTKNDKLYDKLKERISPEFSILTPKNKFHGNSYKDKNGVIRWKHYKVRCNNCGYEFESFLGKRSFRNKIIDKPVCPNCTENYKGKLSTK